MQVYLRILSVKKQLSVISHKQLFFDFVVYPAGVEPVTFRVGV